LHQGSSTDEKAHKSAIVLFVTCIKAIGSVRILPLTLVIAFQPVACLAGEKNAEARAIVKQFKILNPDVEITFPLIETWPADMFSVPVHVRHDYADRVGDRLGKAMADIVARHGY
jgi:hypothetical protein